MCTPVNPSFTTLKWGLRGFKVYRRVFVMMITSSIPHLLHLHASKMMLYLYASRLYDFIKIRRQITSDWRALVNPKFYPFQLEISRIFFRYTFVNRTEQKFN